MELPLCRASPSTPPARTRAGAYAAGGLPIFRHVGFTVTHGVARALLRLGATVVDRATERRVRRLAQLLLIAAAVFVVLRARSLWHGSHVELAGVDWLALAGSFVLAAAGTAAAALIWLVILDGLG